MANHNEQEDISVSSEIAEIVFSGTSDGFHGSVIVRDSEGSPREFHCTNCLSNSPTFDLKNIYIDSDMNGEQNLPDTANCQNSCHFVSGELTIINRILSLKIYTVYNIQQTLSQQLNIIATLFGSFRILHFLLGHSFLGRTKIRLLK